MSQKPRRSWKPNLERLESRENPVSKLPGDYGAQNIASNWEFDQVGTYNITGNITVNPGVTLTVGQGATVVLKAGNSLTVNGTLSAGPNAAIQAQEAGAGTSEALVIGSSGKLVANGVTFSRVGGTNSGKSTSSLTANAGANVSIVDSSIAWDWVEFKNGTILTSGATKQVRNTTFDTDLYLPAMSVPAVADNKSFYGVLIGTGVTTGNNLVLSPIGTVTTANQYYAFWESNFTIQAAASMTLAADTHTVMQTGTTVTVGGTFNVTDPASFAFFESGTSTAEGIVVNGVMNATNASFTRSNDFNSGKSTSYISVSANGRLKATGSVFECDWVEWVNGSLMSAGNTSGNVFRSDVYVPANYIPLMEENASFGAVFINPGSVTGASLILEPLGTVDPANQRYIFYAYGSDTDFTVNAGDTLAFGPGTNVVIGLGLQVVVNGTLDFERPALVSLSDSGTGTYSGITVGDGGLLMATEATFTRENEANSGKSTSYVTVASGGRFEVQDSNFRLDYVEMQNGSLLDAGDATGNIFETALYTPADLVPLWTDNKQFYDVHINPGTVTLSELELAPMGLVTTANQRFVINGGLSIPVGTVVSVKPGTSVLLLDNSSITVGGELDINSAAAFEARDLNSGTSEGVVVAAGGILTVDNTAFSREGGTNLAKSTSYLTVNSGGKLNLIGGKFAKYGWDVLTLNSGSDATIRYTLLDSTLAIHSSATTYIEDNDFTVGLVVASGGTNDVIDLDNNWWGTTNDAQIQSLITDDLDNSALPLVDYTPPLEGRPVRAAGVSTAVNYTVAGQTVVLTAYFTSPSSSVDEGMATFTILDGANTVGTPPDPVSVSAGEASAVYTLPAGLAQGTYTIRVAYDGGSNYAPSVDQSKTLTINPQLVTTFAGPTLLSEGSRATYTLTPAGGSGDYKYSFANSVAGLSSTYAEASSAKTFTYSPTDNTTYTLYYRVFDGIGKTTSSKVITVTNVVPTSTGINGPSGFNEGGTQLFSLAGVGDVSTADSGSLRYTFALSSGALATTWANAKTTNSFSFTPANDGKYTIYARVVDKDNGLSDLRTIVVTAANVPPTVTITGTATQYEGVQATYTANATDPSSDDASSLRYAFSTNRDTLPTTRPASTVRTFTNTRGDNGTFTVYARVFDDDGYRTASKVVNVRNVAPTIGYSGSLTPDEGRAYTYTITGTDVAADLPLRYSFATSQAGLKTTYASASTVNKSVRTLSDDGPYTLWMRTIDPDNGFRTLSRVVNVRNVAPTAPAGITSAAYSYTAGNTLRTFTLAATDAAGDLPGLRYSFTVNSTAALAANWSAARPGNTFTYRFTAPGTYVVFAKSYDDDGGISRQYQKTITVT